MNNEKMLKLWFFFLSTSKRVNGCICIKYRGQRYDKIVHAIAVRIRLLVLFRIMNLFWCYDVNAFPMLLWKKEEKNNEDMKVSSAFKWKNKYYDWNCVGVIQ